MTSTCWTLKTCAFVTLSLFASAAATVISGSRVQLRSASTSRYVCVHSGISYGLMAAVSTPWLHGCTFELFQRADKKWTLKAMKTMRWLGAYDGVVTAVWDENAAVSFNLTTVLSHSSRIRLSSEYGVLALASNETNTTVGLSTGPVTASSLFEVAIVPYVRGVNLGSLFIPENWMTPSFYAGTSATDLCSIVSWNKTTALERISKHIATFINETDIEWLHSKGFNSVRLPLGYWNIIGTKSAVPAIPYVPGPEQSLPWVDRLFDWTEKRNITVLLDLHGAPGGQNGFDNSGCASANGTYYWDIDSNKELTVSAISALAKRYASRSNLFGIEVLNEPGYALEQLGHWDLYTFYTQAYQAVRNHSASAVVMFAELWDVFGYWWNDQLVEEQGFYNVVMDVHKYDCFGNDSSKTLAEHLAQAASWGPLIDAYQTSNSSYLGHPVMVGEWSLATGSSPNGQVYASAESCAWKRGFGYYFWSLKKEGGPDATWSLYDVVNSGITI